MTRELLKDWYPLLEKELERPYCQKLKEELRAEYKAHKVYPSPHNIFKAFQMCRPEEVRVVIIGQDPYPNGDHADGLAFSSQKKDTPYSLQRILREVDRDVVRTKDLKEFKEAFPDNRLDGWARQGVLLLNSVLTVRAGAVGSHHHLGWQEFTTKALELIAADTNPKVFVAWGAEARKIVIDMATRTVVNESNNHLILESGHPASGAHGKDKFSGNNHFSKINRHFSKLNLTTINWRLS